MDNTSIFNNIDISKLIVSVDYDSTLTREDVQEYVKFLLNKGVTVYVITSRYDDLHLSHNNPLNVNNHSLYETIDKLGIPRFRVRFTCMDSKSNYIYNTPILWHLDDDIVEIEEMMEKSCKAIGVYVEVDGWKEKCDQLLLQKGIPIVNEPDNWVHIDSKLPMMHAIDLFSGGTEFKVKYADGTIGTSIVGGDHHIWEIFAREDGITHWWDEN